MSAARRLSLRHVEYVEWAAAELGAPVHASEVVWALEGRTTLRLTTNDGVYFLKVAPGLEGERDRLVWLAPFLPVPAVVAFAPATPNDLLLTEALPGSDLTREEHKRRPEAVVERLVEALHAFHALDPARCPFGRAGDGHVVVHGDACLPNFLVEHGRVSGYVDVGGAGLAPAETDLAAAVWSLQYNLGPGWGGRFLAAYGWPRHDDATVEALRRSYAP